MFAIRQCDPKEINGYERSVTLCCWTYSTIRLPYSRNDSPSLCDAIVGVPVGMPFGAVNLVIDSIVKFLLSLKRI